MADSLRFAIEGTDLFYEVPSEVTNPPVFDMRNGVLRVVGYGFLPRESVFSVRPDGELAIHYDFGAQGPNFERAFEEVKAICGIPENDLLRDSFISYYLKSVEQFIRNYCALREVPDELFYVWVEMAASKAKANEHGFADWENAAPTTIKDGSQSVSYGTNVSGRAVGLSSEERNEFLNGWGHQLRQFRRFKWG